MDDTSIGLRKSLQHSPVRAELVEALPFLLEGKKEGPSTSSERTGEF